MPLDSKLNLPRRRQINFINFFLIALRDRLAIDFDFLKNIDAAHFWGKIVLHDDKLVNFLVVLQPRVELLDPTLQRGLRIDVGQGGFAEFERLGDAPAFGHEERGDKGSMVAEQDPLTDKRLVFQLQLDERRVNARSVHAIKNVLFPADDSERAVGIEGAQVARMVPAVRVENLPCRLGILKITGRNRGAANEDFSVRGDANFDVGKGLAQIAWPVLADAAERHATALGGTVGADQRNADQFEKAHDPRRHRRAAV